MPEIYVYQFSNKQYCTWKSTVKITSQSISGVIPFLISLEKHEK